MKIDTEKCTGCELCHPYCPVGAIVTWSGTAKLLVRSIKRSAWSAECATYETRICPVDAIYRPTLEWPRTIREAFSNPNAKHPSGSQGRGTEEMKTNDVTDRYPRGMLVFALRWDDLG